MPQWLDAWLEKLKEKPAIAHLWRTQERFLARMGNQFAGAITYFSILSVVQVLMFGFSMLAIKLRLAETPVHATRTQMIGISLLCGVGFTMSLFISLLAFAGDLHLQDEAKLGILGGSLMAGVLGFAVLRFARPHQAGSQPDVPAGA